MAICSLIMHERILLAMRAQICLFCASFWHLSGDAMATQIGRDERCRSRRQRLKRIFGRARVCCPVLSLYLRGCVAFRRMAAMASTSSSCPAATLITRS